MRLEILMKFHVFPDTLKQGIGDYLHQLSMSNQIALCSAIIVFLLFKRTLAQME